MYKVGDIVKCQVTGYRSYGIFVKVDDNFNGLIHISEVSNNFVKNVSDYAMMGEMIKAKIIGIDWPNNHLNLSIKNIDYKTLKVDKIKDNGFIPLKNELNIWINEKLQELKK